MREAQLLAIRIIKLRKKIRRLINCFYGKQYLSKEEKQKAFGLIAEVNRQKNSLIEAGFDFDSVMANANTTVMLQNFDKKINKKSLKKTNKKKLRSSLKRGGVGMYGLGNSPKFWR